MGAFFDLCWVPITINTEPQNNTHLLSQASMSQAPEYTFAPAQEFTQTEVQGRARADSCKLTILSELIQVVGRIHFLWVWGRGAHYFAGCHQWKNGCTNPLVCPYG